MGLSTQERVEVAVGTVIDEETGVVRDVEVGIESREERVVEEGENVGFDLDLRELSGG